MTSVVHSDTYPAIDPAKLNMTNKSVFITGASRGLGRAIAVSFAKAGASFIAIGGRSDFTETTEAIQWGAASAGRPAPVVMPLRFEMTDPAGVEEAAVKVRKAFGRVDIVVNNAGLFGTLGKVVDSDQENFRQVIDTNIYGPYLVARAFIPLMLESGGDRTLLTISSVAAHLVLPGLASYQISKLGVLRLTQLLNAEYADQGFLAYAVHPGNVKTDMTGTMENGPPSASIGEFSFYLFFFFFFFYLH